MRQSIIILLLFLCTAALSQQQLNYNFRHIDQTNGLLYNAVHSIVQDKRGFMWIATEKGLQRFDGLRFINYQSELSDINSSKWPELHLYADNNYLWVSADYQFKKLEFITNRFTGYDKEQILNSSLFKYDTYTDWNNRKWLINDFAFIIIP